MYEFRLSREFRNKKIKISSREEIEPQEILLDSLARKKEEELGVSQRKFETPLSARALKGFLFLILFSNLFLLVKTFQFQVAEGKNFFQLSERNKFTVYQIRAERGVIYDKNGNQLVWNSPSFDLVLDIKSLPENENEKTRILKEVSEIIKKDFNELKEEIEKSELPQRFLAQDLDHEKLILLETKIEDFPGFQIRNNTIREYKSGPNFSHLIGYTGKITAEELKSDPEQYSVFDWVGRAGIENSYEQFLRKDPGKLRIERDAKGKVMSQEVIFLPESGKSLVLWLDSQLQEKIEEVLQETLKNIGAEKAMAVVLDPKTGGVLSLVSIPGFDNNLFQRSSDPKVLQDLFENSQKPLFNRVIAGLYPVGSTIKPLIASAVLQEKIISPEKLIYDSGRIEVPHKYNPEIVYYFEDWKAHGWVDLRKAIAVSCNVYFYTVGGGFGNQEGLGPTRIKKYLELFGWGSKTQIDLPGEKEGFLPSPDWKKEIKKEGWWDGDTYHLSIGQGDLLATPLQVAAAFAAIANNGKLLQPHIVQKIIDEQKNVIEEIEPVIIRENFIDSENLQIVREGMRDAVIYGSSAILNNLPVKVASKTGTAQTNLEEYYHNWVTVFAPYDDPQIVLTIMIENAKGMQLVLQPAKSILEWYFQEEK